jgi:hypothetical protein
MYAQDGSIRYARNRYIKYLIFRPQSPLPRGPILMPNSAAGKMTRASDSYGGMSVPLVLIKVLGNYMTERLCLS